MVVHRRMLATRRKYKGYEELKPSVLKRDNYTCQICGDTLAHSRLLDQEICQDAKIHHIDGDSRNNTIQNLTTLCSSCHASYHRRKTFEERNNRKSDYASIAEKVRKSRIDAKMKDEIENVRARLFDQIWNRDKGTCRKCGRRLYETVDPYEELKKELQDIKEIEIYKWVKTCWKCGKETQVVTYHVTFGEDFLLGDIKKLDTILMGKYPHIREAYSKTMDEKYVANTCVNCGALQGKWFIQEDLMEMMAEGDETHTLYTIDERLPNPLNVEDFYNRGDLLPYEVRLPIAEIGFVDGNDENKEPENMILICTNCRIRNPKRSKRQ